MICRTHGSHEGYIVCVHVIAGGTMAHYLQASDKPGPFGLGEALCTACVESCNQGIQPLQYLRMICSICLERLKVREN